MFSSSASRSIASSAVSRTIAGIGVQPGRDRRAQPPLPHHQLVAVASSGRHDDRLQHAELAHRVGQLGQRVLVEDLAGLLGVGVDRVDRQLGEAARRRPAQVALVRRSPRRCRWSSRPAAASTAAGGRRGRSSARRRSGRSAPSSIGRGVRVAWPAARSGSAPRGRGPARLGALVTHA